MKIGSGENHRYNLSDGILLKDNHVTYAGGVKNAVEKAKKNSSFVRKIEVENLSMVKEALSIIGDSALVECSGNITLDNISAYVSLGVDFISSGALTHSSPCLDFSMKNLMKL